VTYTPVDGRIGCWDIVEKQYERVEYVLVRIMKLKLLVTSLSVNVLWLVAFLLPLPLSYPKKEIGKPRKEIQNLNGFVYRYLSGLKVPYL
jgi:hypothetical protein